MATDGVPHLVKAIHNFKGTNNDELCFKKGDIITVTQVVDGGWWEGTLNGITGWFPSNYVKDHKPDAAKTNKNSPVKQVDGNLVVRQENMKLYRSMVFKDMLDTEATHIQELQNLWQNFLLPLQKADIVNEKEWRTLVGNLEEVLECQKSLHAALEEIKERPPKEQRIGGVFMQSAPRIKAVHLTYCANHPKAVVVIENYRDALSRFMEEHGASSPGILALTTGLSRLFRRLEKYSALLQELQRHTEESHVDRGDTQRAAFVYRDISTTCVTTRRQKEMELEVMTGAIREWEGEDIQTLGDLIHMGPVVVLTEVNERKDRYLVLFTGTLVILSVSSRRSAFVYEGKLPLSAVSVKKIEASENLQHAFEITGSMIQRIVIVCHNAEDADNWLTLLHQQIRTSHLPSGVIAKGGDSPARASQISVPLSPVHNHIPQMLHGQPPPPPHSSTCSILTVASQDGRQTPQTSGRIVMPFKPPSKMWTMWSLRPHPPMRPCLGVPTKEEVVLRRSHSKRKAKSVVADEKGQHEDDMKILQVIEAYCTSAKTRYTVNSALLDSPQVLIAEEEKIIVEETRGNTTVVEEKSLVDTVYALKDQVKELKEETANLAKNLEEEKHARQRLETLLRKCVFQGKEDLLAGLQED